MIHTMYTICTTSISCLYIKAFRRKSNRYPYIHNLGGLFTMKFGTKSEKLGWIIIPLGVCVMVIGACNN